MILVASEKYKKIEELTWNEPEKISGKIIMHKRNSFEIKKRVLIGEVSISCGNASRTECKTHSRHSSYSGQLFLPIGQNILQLMTYVKLQ